MLSRPNTKLFLNIIITIMFVYYRYMCIINKIHKTQLRKKCQKEIAETEQKQVFALKNHSGL